MAFETFTPLISYPADGVTTTFAIPDKFYDASDVKLFYVNAAGEETSLDFGVDYSVVITATDPTPPARKSGQAVFITPPIAGGSVVVFIWPDVDQDQPFEGRPVTPRQNERAHDRHAMRDAALRELLFRGFRAPLNAPPGLRFIEVGAAGRVPIYDEFGNLIEGPTVGEVLLVSGIVTEIMTVAAIAPQIVAVAGNATNINLLALVDDSIAALGPVAPGIAALAPVNDEISILAPIAASIVQVAVGAAFMETVATNIASVNVVAANITSVNTVANNIATILGIPALVASFLAENENRPYVWQATPGQTVFLGANATPPRTTPLPGKPYTFVKVGGRALHQSEYSLAGANLTLLFPTSTTTSEEVELIASGARPASGVPAAGSVTANEISDDAVSNQKLANMATATIKGRATAGTGDPQDLTGEQARAIVMGGALGYPLLHVQEQRPSGTDGGNKNNITWDIRQFNTTLTAEIPGAVLNAGKVTLDAGTYEVIASAVVFEVQNHKLRLYNETTAATLVAGVNGRSAINSNVMTVAELRGRFVLAATSVLNLSHWSDTSKSGNGLGVGALASSGSPEVFADMQIRKIK